ncbi:hypothetical protein [Stutzerimonas balearica]|uniref:hypothetical protein n=1 Tax=Stutzerimonas balearica TaxID=74829 RepID=UPI00289F2185|nr:hypothetical protein [Stutzerimonas balearica]
MQIRLIEGKLKSISFRTWPGVPNLGLPISGCHVQSSCDKGMTRGTGQNAVGQLISGILQ